MSVEAPDVDGNDERRKSTEEVQKPTPLKNVKSVCSVVADNDEQQ